MDGGLAHYQDQLQVQHDIEQALAHAVELGLPINEVSLLAWASGVQFKPKEVTHHG